MKHFTIILLFIILSLLTPTSIFAQSSTEKNYQCVVIPVQEDTTLLQKIINLFTSKFIRNKYQISQRDDKKIYTDMVSYDSKESKNNDPDKHSHPGSRLNDKQSQECYKGHIIRNVILEDMKVSSEATSAAEQVVDPKYENTKLDQVCLKSGDDCNLVRVADLAIYFVQINQEFYCDDEYKFVPIDGDVIIAVNKYIEKHKNDSDFEAPISSAKLDCYDVVYKDFYLIPHKADKNEENSKKIIKTPISKSDQNSGNSDSSDTDGLEDQLDQNFSIYKNEKSYNSKANGLEGLYPKGWLK